MAVAMQVFMYFGSSLFNSGSPPSSSRLVEGNSRSCTGSLRFEVTAHV